MNRVQRMHPGGAGKMSAKMRSQRLPVRVIDTTLREGCQAPGVRLNSTQSVEIATALAALGVDTIECGHPSVPGGEMDRVRRVAKLGLDCPVLTHARARRDDIMAAAESGASWVGIFLGINELTRRTRVPNRSAGQILSYIQDSVAFARKCGLRVRYTVEDASRTEYSLILQAFEAALDAGAHRLCFADTVGMLEPNEIASHIRSLKEAFPGVDLEVHLHDDRGLALANALAAIDAGADWVSTSVNGLGERSGITDLCVLLVNLHYRRERELVSGPALKDISDRVAAYSRTPVDFHRPVTGRNAFIHSARLHVKAVLRDERAYNWIPPEIVGARSLTAVRRHLAE